MIDPLSADDTAELLTLMETSAAGSGMAVYDRFADRVHDFVLFITRDAGLAAEITRDVVVMTANTPTRFTSVEALRAWLYAQARDEVFALLAARGRLPSEDRVIPLEALPEDHTDADLAAMVWVASAAFSERDLALLTLHLRHGLDGQALGDAMGLSTGAVDVLLPSTLERVSQQVTALVALADARLPIGAFPQIEAVRQEWDGTFSPLVRRRALEMAEELEAASSTMPSPLELLQSVPLAPAPASLRAAVDERLQLTAPMTAGGRAVAAADEADHTIPPPSETIPPLSDTIPPLSETIPPLPATPPPSPATPPPSSPATPPLSAATPPVPVPASGDPVVAPPVGPEVVPAPPTSSEAAIAGTAAGEPVTVGPAVAPPPPPATADAGDPATSRRRLPPVLAVALGVAVALVVVAGLVRTVVDDDPSSAEGLQPVLVTPPSEGPTTAAAPAPPPPGAELPDAAGPAAAMAAVPGATRPTATGATATPGTIGVPARTLVVEAGTGAPLRLTNPGGTAVAWQVVERPGWVVTDRASGTVGPGAVVEVLVSRSGELAEGDYGGQIAISWDGEAAGTVRAEVRGASERVPVLQDVQVGSRALLTRGCGLDQTEVAVVVADESPLAEVTVVAAREGEATTVRFTLGPDPERAGRYVGVIGPFDEPGGIDLVIEAADARGNDAEADGGGLAIAPCLGG